MTDPTPTPIDPARVLAVLEVLGWPDDRQVADTHQEPLDWADPPRVYWELAEDVIRAADAASPEQHVIEFAPGSWTIHHPRSCPPDRVVCPVWRAADRDLAIFAHLGGQPPYLGRYECSANDLRDRLLIGDRVDLAVSSDG